ncbi:MAG TPA: helix-hairpin-helix domain-containing protein [Bryobacteraceae bacterium]|jgi:DNA uptake protein ComE-like DNA-binding protein|nr:helix-hairpin-helix domain-containing protein [Terracidiphilus sp.]HTA46089.1 helix-hairpin-helix domain-containing protein [Bryobacteraceae bacterium]
MKRFFFGTLALLCLAGCTQANPSPEQIRQDAAKATSTTVQDVKAAAKGVADGIKQQKTSPDKRAAIDINRASADDLQTLPGIDGVHAHKIIDNRPYGDASDLVKKHVVSGTEFDRISDKIVAQ